MRTSAHFGDQCDPSQSSALGAFLQLGLRERREIDVLFVFVYSTTEGLTQPGILYLAKLGSWEWWYVPVFHVLRRLRQKDQSLRATQAS